MVKILLEWEIIDVEQIDDIMEGKLFCLFKLLQSKLCVLVLSDMLGVEFSVVVMV